MKTLRIRLALFLLALVAFTAAMLPAPSHAVVTCCGYTIHYTYFTTAAHGTLAGSCVYNEACTGAIYCSGVKTAYYTTSSTCCPRCSD